MTENVEATLARLAAEERARKWEERREALRTAWLKTRRKVGAEAVLKAEQTKEEISEIETRALFESFMAEHLCD